MSLDTVEYNKFVEESLQGTLFCTTWWLNTVAPERYQILTIEKGGTIHGAWPIILNRSRLGETTIGMASLTPWLGVLYRPPASPKLANQLSEQKSLSAELIQKLPKFDALNIKFHRNFDYWSPFYWEGFDQTTRYTYVLENLSDLDAVWQGLRSNIRREIRKANKEGVIVKETENIETFLDLNTMTFERQGMNRPYDADFVRRVDAACKENGVRKIFVGRGRDGAAHAAAYIVWDDKSAYYLMGGGNPDKRTSGATSLVMWEAIKFASTVTNTFDFEGSMIESVERFFRAFGAKPCPYYAVSKINSTLRKIHKLTSLFPRIDSAYHKISKVVESTQ
jgi:hypothetical protein